MITDKESALELTLAVFRDETEKELKQVLRLIQNACENKRFEIYYIPKNFGLTKALEDIGFTCELSVDMSGPHLLINWSKNDE